MNPASGELSVRRVTDWLVDGQPNPDLVAACDLNRRQSRHDYGHEDFCSTPEVVARNLSTPVKPHAYYVAVDGDRALGAVHIVMPDKDNVTTAELDMVIDPEADAPAVFGGLIEAAEPMLREAGRTVWMAWTGSPQDAKGEPLEAATGSGTIPNTPQHASMLANGWRLEQVERNSVLEVHAERDVTGLRREAEDKAAGYEVVSWEGATPEHLLDSMAVMRARMSIDAPMGEMAFEMENWDADRVREHDRVSAERDRTMLWTAALFEGDVVAYTLLDLPPDNLEVAYQGDTVVHGDHRGHRLGMLVKLANLDQLRAARPGVQRVHTWNADENQWMLAVNVAMGFEVRALEGCWQKKV
ncbi:GNAT family protein [Mariniluteicoccus flavus]